MAKKSLTKTCINTTVNTEQSRNNRDGQEQPKKIMLAKATLHTIEVVEQIQPRIIRLKNAPQYLGMNRNLFNKEVRPGLVTVPIGQQGIGFDRLDLDAWVDAYKQCNGRPRDISGVEPWVKETRQDSANAGTSGTSRKRTTAVDFSKVLEQAISPKPSDS